jgi:mRNA turnover protein 4
MACWEITVEFISLMYLMVHIHSSCLSNVALLYPSSYTHQRYIIIVALTKTAKKTRDHKTNYIETVREAIDANDRLYLFSYENMRSNHFKDVRLHFRGSGSDKNSMSDDNNDSSSGADGRIFLGKNKLLQIALGRGPEDEYSDNLHKLSKILSGSVGILCTNQSASDVEEYFAKLAVEDFARAGAIAPRSVSLTKEQVETHPVSMVEQFRKLGLPVEVKNGRVSFIGGRDEWELCKEGKELTVEQCKILVHFGVKLAVFKIDLVCRWERDEGTVEEF